MYAADLGMARISEDCCGELEFSFCQRARLGVRKAWNGIVARIEAIGADAGEIARRRFGARALSAVLDPDRRIIARCIEGFNGSLGFSIDDAVNLAAEHVADLLANALIQRQHGSFGRSSRR